MRMLVDTLSRHTAYAAHVRSWASVFWKLAHPATSSPSPARAILIAHDRRSIGSSPERRLGPRQGHTNRDLSQEALVRLPGIIVHGRRPSRAGPHLASQEGEP